MLDFLRLAGTYNEATLEQAIVGRVQEFIMEMGSGFAFVERQKRISKEWFVDKLHRAIAIARQQTQDKPTL